MSERLARRLALLWPGRRPTPPPDMAPPPPSPPPSIARLPPASDAVGIFHLRPIAGGLVAVAGDRRLELSATPGQDALALAVIPAALPHLCLLLAPDGGNLRLDGDGQGGIAISLRILRIDREAYVRLRHPQGERAFLAARPPRAIALDGTGTTQDAVFNLLPLPAHAPPAVPAAAIAAEIGRAASGRLDPDWLLDDLHAGRLRADLAAPLLRCLPREALADLARHLLDRPQRLVVLQNAMPDDPFLQNHLPRLAAWNLARTAAAPPAPAEDAALILPVVTDHPIPPGLGLLVLARRQIQARRGACLLATARNEGAYLIDWISYHLAAGFEHIFLYSNDNTDGSDALLALLAQHGVITWIDNARSKLLTPQQKAYAHALTLLPQILDFRWAAILDLDEYFAFDTARFAGVADVIALQEAQPVDAIALCWAMFAALPGESWSAAPTVTRFPRRVRDINRHVKTLLRPRLFWHALPHNPIATFAAPFRYRTEDGSLHHHDGVTGRLPAFAERPSADHAWINHYMLRTAPEAVWKFARGRASWREGGAQLQRFLDLIVTSFLDFAQPETLVEDRRAEACARGQNALRQSILALPGVGAVAAEIEANFPAQLRRATEDFLAAPAPAGAPARLEHFRRMVQDGSAKL
jgi:hypothetical protein